MARKKTNTKEKNSGEAIDTSPCGNESIVVIVFDYESIGACDIRRECAA